MKAKQDFEIYVDNGKLIPHYSGEFIGNKQKLKFKKNDELPDNIVSDLLRKNPDLLQVEYSSGKFKLTEEEQKKYNLPEGKIELRPFISPRKYSQDSLTRILNEKGVNELKKIAEEEFNMKNVKVSKNLITNILLRQEEIRNVSK